MVSTLAIMLTILVTSLGGWAQDVNDTDIDGYRQSPVDFIYPPSRSGFNSTTASYENCGGLAVSATRTKYPLTGGKVSIRSLGVAANIDIMYANSSNPTSYHQLSTYTAGILIMSPGGYCTDAPDFYNLGMTRGDNVTLTIFYQLYGSNRHYYHCADLTLIDHPDVGVRTYKCTNTSTVLKLGSSNAASGEDGQTMSVYAASALGASPSDTASNTTVNGFAKSSLSAAAGGGIGAGLALAVVAVVMSLLFWRGIVSFKHRKLYMRDPKDNSSVGSGFPLRTTA